MELKYCIPLLLLLLAMSSSGWARSNEPLHDSDAEEQAATQVQPRESSLSKPRSLMEDRIYGGEELTPHSWPFLVQVRLYYGCGTEWICGGSIVDALHVVTAAHCACGKLAIRAGEHNLDEEEGTEQNIDVESYCVHPDYNAGTERHDVAVLKLSSPLYLDANVNKIALDSVDCSTQVPKCNVSGWGETEDGNVSNVPLTVKVSVVKAKKCEKAYKKEIDLTYQICAGDEGLDSCYGDSGGPLMCTCKGVNYLSGIVSWGGSECGDEKHPGVYTRVYKYLDWIESTIAGGTRCK